MNKLKLNIKSKKFKLIFSCLILCMVISLTGIVAYLSDADTSDNKFVIGGNKVALIEEFDPPEELTPGVSFNKNVKVKNVSLTSCYVRIKAVFTNSDVGQYCNVDWNTQDWVYNSEDGYWYYKTAISKGEITTSLFTTIKLADDTPASAIKDFDMIIYGESYQSEGFSNYEEAWADYEKNKVDKLNPALNIVGLTATTTENPSYTNTTSYEVALSASDSGSGIGSVVVNDVNATMTGNNTWVAVITLKADEVEKITAVATDKAGNSTTRTGYVRADIEFPTLEVLELEGTTSDNPLKAKEVTYTMSGTVSDNCSGIRNVTVNGVEVAVDEEGKWMHTLNLTVGETMTVNVVCTDKVGNTTTKTGYVLYTETVNYAITNTLTHVSSDNVTESVESDSSYTAVLEVEDGYELDVDSLVVTMGTVDITSEVYNDGTITIDSVTDNVVITATAHKIYTITNELQHVTSNNNATTIKENEVYTATLTADEGYDLNNLKVVIMMGDKDITSEVYENGIIIIDTVTANIIIMVTEEV